MPQFSENEWFNFIDATSKRIRSTNRHSSFDPYIRSLKVSEQRSLMSECLECYDSIKSFGRKYEIAIVYFALLSAQNYSGREINKIIENNGNTINHMFLLIKSDPVSSRFDTFIKEGHKFQTVLVRVRNFRNQAVVLELPEKMALLSHMLPEPENFDVTKDMYVYLVVLEELLSTAFIRAEYYLENVKNELIQFVKKYKTDVNRELLKEKGFPIFSNGALLSKLQFCPAILDVDVKYKYLEILGKEDRNKCLWNIFGEYLSRFEDRFSKFENDLPEILLRLTKDGQGESKFVEKYYGLVNGESFMESIPTKSLLCPFFLSVPKLLGVKAKYRLLKFMDICQQYDWLDECFTRYQNISVTDQALRMIDDVCASISKIGDTPIQKKRRENIKEMHSHLICSKILPRCKYYQDREYLNIEKLLKPTIKERLASIQKTLKTRSYGELEIEVNRNNILESSYNMTSELTAEQWRTKIFKITFENEPGVDAGGLLREWFTITTKEILNPNFGLFIPTPGDVNSYMINKSSHVNQDHLEYFKFIGRFLAKGILENIHLDCPLTKVLYKHIVGARINYSDFEGQDPEFFNSLRFILNNPIKEAGLDLTFSTEIEHFGGFEERELIGNGKNIPVTDKNKHTYVNLISAMKMTGSIRPQLRAFLSGFADIIPKDLIKVFDEKELEMLLCGQSEIDVEDLKANTLYSEYNQSDDVIRWFWEALKSFNKEDKARFLMYATGSSKAPLDGFSSLRGSNGIQKFRICKDSIVGDRLPTARTCFNQLLLPQYTSYEILREKLLLAIREGAEGFGLA